jgi:hypothetical protein
MNTLKQYFSDNQIIRELCKARVKLAKQRNERQYLGRLIGRQTHRVVDDDVGILLPPRKAWPQFRPLVRQTIKDVDLVSLERAALTLRRAQPRLPWVIRLNTFINKVQSRVLNSPTFTFAPPEVRWELKKRNEYRAICRFNLEDNLINGLTAKYLKDFFDPAFEDSSYAFRTANKNRQMPTHHSAFNHIFQIRQSALRERLYVAECDIKGFYDSVDHGVAATSFKRVVDLVEKAMTDRKMDPRAVAIFRAYLNCYSFPHNVLGEAAARLKREDPDGVFPWPAKALRKHQANPFQARIGVPQGGAISCLISNLVLDLADRRIKPLQQPGTELHYLRYCDDMVLIAQRKWKCRLAYQIYLKALDDLKLPYHPAKTIKSYGKDFWSDKTKSKAPYCWSGEQKGGFVPWVQFVGYQIRYDGLVRPKPKSVKKQLNALKETVDGVKWRLLKKSRPFPKPYETPTIVANRSQAENSVQSKLTSMGVGRVKVNQITEGPLPMCWCNGFKALHGKPLVPTFLKQLDRERERQIRRFKRAKIVYGFGRRLRSSGGRQKPSGYMDSYYAQFNNDGGKHLIAHPYRDT